MTYVTFVKVLCTAVLAMYGLTPFWCDSCGESYLTSDMVVCDVCGAHVCTGCADAYETEHGIGCFVCEGDSSVSGHDPENDAPDLQGFYF